MSIKKVQNVIDRFISNKDPEVLSIKGGWGVGKTYFWNSVIKAAASKSKHNAFTHYAYVSLFGITTLEELKSTLFEQIIEKSQIGKKFTIDNLKRNSEELTKNLGKNTVSFLQEIPRIKNINTAIQSTSYINDKNLIICFDDFERKGEGLNIKDIMGLVSILKEQRDCKVVLIMSDSNLDSKSFEEYWQFREKVIDIEIRYEPSFEEAAKLAFKGNPHNYDRLKQLSTQLRITNIRILNKIEKSVNDVLKILENFEPEISDQVMHTLMLLTVSYYTHINDFIPPYLYIKEIGYKLYGLDTDKSKVPNEIKWDSVLREYGFQNFDDFDIALSNVIETGYVDHDVLLTKAKAQNELILSNKSQVSFSHAWDMYHHSFNDNSDELLTSLGNSLIENAKHISPADMNATVRLFKRLDKDDEGSMLVDQYIEINKDHDSIFDLDKNPLSNNIDDEEVIEKFNQRYYEIKNIKNAEDVLVNITMSNNQCSQSDEAILAKTSINQFYELFKKQNGVHLSNYVDSCLQFGRIDEPTLQQNQITENATQALVKIGYENQLNALRVRKFGVDIYEYDKPS